MAEKETPKPETIEVWKTKKPEGPVDKTKATQDQAAPSEGEVEGRWLGSGSRPPWAGRGRWVRCWHCGSLRHVYQTHPGEVFICRNCGYEYIPD